MVMFGLARAFAPTAETWVIAPLEDESSSGDYTSVAKRKALAVEPRNLGEGIRAFGGDGYPADCVILALAGIMRDRPPDLVTSGINGGANLGPPGSDQGPSGQLI